MTSFREARDLLLRHRTDYPRAYAEFRWPQEPHFNWAVDWFDGVLAKDPASASRPALWITDASGAQADLQISFAELAARSSRVAHFLTQLGVRRGDRLLLVLGNIPALWEVFLAAMKLGISVIPATTLLTAEELRDRIERGRARCIVAAPDQLAKFAGTDDEGPIRVVAEGSAEGWHALSDAHLPGRFSSEFRPDEPADANRPLFVYFTSGTTSKPKLVVHTNASYPVGHLSTMYWLGLQPGDIHLNISSPGWAKHAWSCVFAPWNAGATVFIATQPRFEAKPLLETLVRCGVTSLCAPPTVWRLLVQEDLRRYPVRLRELAGAGEPLNAEIIEQVQAAWGLLIRDGYGQTETTAQIANPPGQPVCPGSMGRPLPGYCVALLDADGQEASEGEISLQADGPERPLGLMAGYEDGDTGALRPCATAFYRTGDVAVRDAQGCFTFVGRADDVFKSSDYRISPFELESVLIEHLAVAEAAVIPVPDPIRLNVPKAYIILAPGYTVCADTALEIFRHAHARLAPFKRLRSVELVAELPKTISGKIRRVQLRQLVGEATLLGTVFAESDFPELSRRPRPDPSES
jgi:acetyl-CoA synthetase